MRSSPGTGSSYSISSNFKANLRRQKRREREGDSMEGGRERESSKTGAKKGKNTLRRQIKNVNIIVCVIVLGRGVGIGRERRVRGRGV